MSNPDPEKQERGQLQHAAEHEKPSKRNPVLFYLMILFAAAFLLLLMSFLMQRRANQEAIDNLQQTSNSASESLENTIQQNEALTKQVEDLQAAASEDQQTIRDQQDQLEELGQQVNDLTRSAQAMDWFWQINEAYVRGRYTQARELIAGMGTELASCLPKESVTDTDRFSPYDRYQEICAALGVEG